jgi:hypothetical protein
MQNRAVSRPKYRTRTRIRKLLPWVLVDRGWAAKGRSDCGQHEWYRQDQFTERCYHCEIGLRPTQPAA